MQISFLPLFIYLKKNLYAGKETVKFEKQPERLVIVHTLQLTYS